MRPILPSVAALCLAVSVADAAEIAAFSQMEPGMVTGGWRLQTIRGRAPAAFRIIDVDGSVVEAIADGGVGSLVHDVNLGHGDAPTLSWRWRIDEAIDGSNVYKKSGDDFPARVYALFDYDPGRLSFGERWKLRIARLLYGQWVPAAALCYVPADDVPPGTVLPNPYSGRVRVIVVDSITPGEWRSFERDVTADFATAFGESPPRLAGIAIAIDTDDTGESARALFGDVVLK